jgi:hypothetical protein
MNINLFKKKNVVTTESLTQTFVTHNEFKELKMMIRQLNKKVDEKHEKIENKNTVIPLLKSLKEINYTFRIKEPKLIEPSNIKEESLTNYEPQTLVVTHKELEEKSKSIIEEIHQHIQDINQYNYTINGYLLQQIKDKIEQQDQLIHELYEKIENNQKND